jgi:DNA-binding response OmpR family regulator
MLRLTFASSGFRVGAAQDGLEALERVAEEVFDIIVLDLQMPRMDGRSFYRELRSRGYDIPVLVLSAYGAELAKDELQADAAVPKPFDPDVLSATVRRVLASRVTGNTDPITHEQS